MKLALMVGGMAAGRRAGGPGQLLAQGTKLLGQSPELGRLTDEVRGRLIEAGKGAAVAVATRQVEALTDRLVNQLATAPEAGGRVASDVGERAGGVGRTVSGLGRRRSRDEDESDRYDEEEPEEEPAEDRAAEEPEDEAAEAEAEEPAEEPEDEAAEAEAEEPEDEAAEAEEDEEPPPAPRRRPVRTGVGGRRAADGTGRAPGSARTASQAAGGRSGRPARGRQGRSDG